MASSVLDQLIGVTPSELELMRKVKEIGATSADELGGGAQAVNGWPRSLTR